MPRFLSSLAVLLSLSLVASLAQAQPQIKRIPAAGVEVPEATKKELSDLLGQLNTAIDELSKSKDAKIVDLLPDVQIYQRAIHDALEYNEFLNAREFPSAKRLLEQGLERARLLKEGQAPWATQTGLVVRGYVSKIDGSVQPYGLVVPDTFVPTGPQRYRLDLWFHGRSEGLTEVSFLNERSTRRGEFSPADTFVLHPYGRYCNAFKFAGEVDVLEGLESVKKRYRIDDDRISVRGFSMGGAACWQFAVHYPDRWFAASPGAGFVETEIFMGIGRRPNSPDRPAWERTLWKMYNCPEIAINFYNLPLVAYSGENDGQKAAADQMDKALKDLGITMTHIIGPKMGHQYHPASKVELDRRFASIAAKGRDHAPREVHFATTTLKYNKSYWITVDGLERHWEPSQVDGWVTGDSAVKVATQKVTALTLEFPSGWAPFEVNEPVSVSIDGQTIAGPRPESDRSWTCQLVRAGNEWKLGAPEGLRKKHDLQGPVDDAFMDSFVFLKPTRKFNNPQVEKWVNSEMEHAIEHWRRHFRGHVRVKNDVDVTENDYTTSHLVLWGDPASNYMLAKVADQLPIKWSGQEIVVGDRRFPSDKHAPILIYPNPLNPEKYVVLNSSFTFREQAYLNNADQTPKLPDWAIVDLETPADYRFPGKIVATDFFDEKWQLKPAK